MEYAKNLMTPSQLVAWAKANLNITRPNAQMTGEEIGRAIRWIGEHSIDTVRLDGEKPKLGRISIDNMLITTLTEFPDFYVKHELWQRN